MHTIHDLGCIYEVLHNIYGRVAIHIVASWTMAPSIVVRWTMAAAPMRRWLELAAVGASMLVLLVAAAPPPPPQAAGGVSLHVDSDQVSCYTYFCLLSLLDFFAHEISNRSTNGMTIRRWSWTMAWCRCRCRNRRAISPASATAAAAATRTCWSTTPARVTREGTGMWSGTILAPITQEERWTCECLSSLYIYIHLSDNSVILALTRASNLHVDQYEYNAVFFSDCDSLFL